jgi:hypothetical protein
MSTLTGPGSGPAPTPRLDGPANRSFIALAQVTEAVRRANHVTALASWTVTTVAMGLVFELAGLRSLKPAEVVLLLALFVPVLAAVVRAVLLLVRAAAQESVVGGEPGWSAGAAADEPPTIEETWARLHRATAAVQYREILAREALRWAYICAGSFLAWSITATLIPKP